MKLAIPAIFFALLLTAPVPATATTVSSEVLPSSLDDTTLASARSAPSPQKREYLDLALKLGDFDAARELADDLLDEDPTDKEALTALCVMQIKTRQRDEALASALKLGRHHPGTEADVLHAAALRLQRRYDEAHAILSRLRDAAPDGEAFRYLNEVGFTYYDAREFDQARACFEQVRDDDRYLPLDRAEAEKQLDNIERDLAIRQAYYDIESRDIAKARKIASNLDRTGPEPLPDITALDAVLTSEKGDVETAAARLEELKRKALPDEPFQYGTAYASQLLDLGRFKEAEAAAAEVADSSEIYFPAEIIEHARRDVRKIRNFSRGAALALGRYESRDEAKAMHGKLDASVPLNDERTRLGVEYAIHHYKLDDPLPNADTTQNDYLGTMRQWLPNGFYADAAAGAIAGHFAYAASLGWSRHSLDNFVELTWSGGRRPIDTLQLETLPAKERRLALAFSGELPQHKRIRASGQAWARQIDFFGSNIGKGWGGELEIMYLIHRRNQSEIAIGYVGAYEKFNYRNESQLYGPADDLLDPTNYIVNKLNSHGIELFVQVPINPDLIARGLGGVSYRFDLDSTEYHLGGGIEWWFSDTYRLFADALYYSSTLAGSTDSGSIEGRFGVNGTF